MSQNLILRREYKLNNKQAREEVGRYDGTIHGTVQNFTDRFGNADGAMKFQDNAYISIPSLLSNFDYKQTGFTVSCWIYIDQSLAKRHGKTPWTETDPVVRAFYAKKNQTPMLGFYRRADRAVLDRYTTNVSGQTVNWGVWLWDPVNFTQQIGWYKLYITYDKGRSFIYVFKPDGQMDGCAHYLGSQDLSAATSWGLGNNSGKSLILDDFRVYQGVATQEQARQLYASETPPNGMYHIKLCANNNQLVHTYYNNTTQGTYLEIYPPGPTESGLHTYKWIITPVPNKKDVYTIRMPYEDKYVSVYRLQGSAMYNAAVIKEYESESPGQFEWYLEPVGDGYFFFRWNPDRSKYLCPANQSIVQSTALFVLPYKSPTAPAFKWGLTLLKTNHEMAQNMLDTDVSYQAVLSDNTFLGLMPDMPITGSSTPVRANRGPEPSLLSSWSFHKSHDDSYRIYNTSQHEYNLHPNSRSIREGNPVEAYTYSSGYSKFYDFVLEKPNKYGRRVFIKPAMNQNLCVAAQAPTDKRGLTFEYKNSGKADQWALYRSNSPNANKQLYFAAPGLYRIVSVADETKSITTQNYGWTASTALQLRTTSNDRYTSHYWQVDYEKTSLGQNIYDGTYMIKLFGTEGLFFHTKGHSLANGVKLEIYPLTRDYIATEKFFFTPTGDGDGSFFIRSAGDPSLYVHLGYNSTAEQSAIELYTYHPGYAASFKWKLEPVAVTAPFADGTHKVATQANLSRYLHVSYHSVESGAALEIYSYDAAHDGSYKWKFRKNADNTYMIINAASNKYVHLYWRTTEKGTKLQQYDYDRDFSAFYKWIIAPGTAAGTYRFYPVVNPSLMMHLVWNSPDLSQQIEIWEYDPAYAPTYEWKLE